MKFIYSILYFIFHTITLRLFWQMRRNEINPYTEEYEKYNDKMDNFKIRTVFIFSRFLYLRLF